MGPGFTSSSGGLSGWTVCRKRVSSRLTSRPPSGVIARRATSVSTVIGGRSGAGAARPDAGGGGADGGAGAACGGGAGGRGGEGGGGGAGEPTGAPGPPAVGAPGGAGGGSASEQAPGIERVPEAKARRRGRGAAAPRFSSPPPGRDRTRPHGPDGSAAPAARRAARHAARRGAGRLPARTASNSARSDRPPPAAGGARADTPAAGRAPPAPPGRAGVRQPAAASSRARSISVAASALVSRRAPGLAITTTSTAAGYRCRHRRKTSRVTRLIRLRITALPTRVLTVTPRRARGPGPGRWITTKQAVCRARPCRWTARKSARRRRRAALG